jgi:hypothetical protein
MSSNLLKTLHNKQWRYCCYFYIRPININMNPKLFMVLIGCKPQGRHTEQHDIFFGIAAELRELIPEMLVFWPEAAGEMHVDGWREVTQVDGQDIKVIPRTEALSSNQKNLFFINLGGYKKDELEEFHYKMLLAAAEKSMAIKAAKQTAFFKHTHFDGANSHIDDQYGIDVDDVYKIEEVLSLSTLSKYQIVLTDAIAEKQDELHLGYFKLSSL